MRLVQVITAFGVLGDAVVRADRDLCRGDTGDLKATLLFDDLSPSRGHDRGHDRGQERGLGVDAEAVRRRWVLRSK